MRYYLDIGFLGTATMVGLFLWPFCQKTALKLRGTQLVNDDSRPDARSYSVLDCVFCRSYTSNREAFHVVWEVRIHKRWHKSNTNDSY